MKPIKQFIIYFTYIYTVLLSGNLYAMDDNPEIDEDVYWLPTSYSKYYLKLKKAAAKAYDLDRCVKVLSATMDTEQSKKDYPIFRILCRQENGVSYNEMVDGVSFETLTTVLPDPEELKRQEELARQKRIQDQWYACVVAVSAQADLIQNSEVLTTERPEFEILEEDALKFILDFDGESIYGEKLKYRAACEVSKIFETQIKVSRRKES